MSDEKQARKALIGEVFDRAATTYDRVHYFWPLGRRLVEQAAIPPGAHGLDGACGRGAILCAAAEQVGPAGQVIGPAHDPSPRQSITQVAAPLQSMPSEQAPGSGQSIRQLAPSGQEGSPQRPCGQTISQMP